MSDVNRNTGKGSWSARVAAGLLAGALLVLPVVAQENGDDMMGGDPPDDGMPMMVDDTMMSPTVNDEMMTTPTVVVTPSAGEPTPSPSDAVPQFLTPEFPRRPPTPFAAP